MPTFPVSSSPGSNSVSDREVSERVARRAAPPDGCRRDDRTQADARRGFDARDVDSGAVDPSAVDPCADLSRADPTRDFGPRERVMQLGEPRLSDAECLALILRTGTPGVRAEALGQRLMADCGGLPGLAAMPLRELAGKVGLGPVRAAALHAAFGLARRLTEWRFGPGQRVNDPGEVARIVRDVTRGSGRESFFALLLDTRHRLLALRTISTGDLCGAPVHPREVFVQAIRERAAALIVAHNHPSGDASPSEQDRAVTERLRQVGELVGIEVLDHVVVGDASYFSFAEARTGVIA